jgi:hypothetical protein
MGRLLLPSFDHDKGALQLVQTQTFDQDTKPLQLEQIQTFDHYEGALHLELMTFFSLYFNFAWGCFFILSSAFLCSLLL